MSVVNASSGDLTNVSTLIRWLTDELIANHRFTARFADVSGTATWGSSDTLRWLDRPQAETFYQDTDLTIGIRNSSSVRGSDSTPIGIGMQIARSLFSVFDPGSGNRWDDVTFYADADVLLHVQAGQGTTINGRGAPVGVSDMESGPFIGARLITNPTSGSATPSEPLYFYVVVEVSVGIFRKFGFGEIDKFYDWNGGIFCAGDIWATGQTFYNTSHSLFGSGHYASLNHALSADEGSHYIYAPGWTGILTTDANEGRGWMIGTSGTLSGANTPRCWPALGWDPRGPLNFMRQTPSPFSLQSERNPAVVFGGNQRIHTGSGFEVHPIGVFPDLFQATISDFTAYGVFQDTDGSKYMVIPHRTKLIDEAAAGGSGRFGLLIRNPDLTVTIT